MAVSVGFTRDGLGITSTYTGCVTDDDLKSSFEFKLNHVDSLKNIRFNIADFTSVEHYKVSTRANVLHAYKTLELFDSEFEDFLTISVVNSELQYGMSRMWGMLTMDGNFRSEIAQSRVTAERLIHTHLKNLPPRELFYSYMSNLAATHHKVKETI